MKMTVLLHNMSICLTVLLVIVYHADLVLGATPSDPPCDVPCRPTPPWFRHNSSCYGRFPVNGSDKLNFNDSREFCQSQGGDLVIIKERQLLDLLKPNGSSNESMMREERYWIGLRRKEKAYGKIWIRRQHWSWVDKTPLTDSLQDWDPNEPGQADQCGVLGYQDKWFANSCQQQKKFICEKDCMTTTTTTTATTVTEEPMTATSGRESSLSSSSAVSTGEAAAGTSTTTVTPSSTAQSTRTTASPSVNGTDDGSTPVAVIAGAAAGGVLVLVVVIVGIVFCCCYKKRRTRQKIPDTHEAYANHIYEMERSQSSPNHYAEVGIGGSILSQSNGGAGARPPTNATALPPPLPSLDTLPRDGLPSDPAGLYSVPSKKKKDRNVLEGASPPERSGKDTEVYEMSKTPEVPRKNFGAEDEDDDMTIMENDLYGS